MESEREFPESMPLQKFLETVPPHIETKITDIRTFLFHRKNSAIYFYPPELSHHCPLESCNATMFFRLYPDRAIRLKLLEDSTYKFIIQYVCSNCQNFNKEFALTIFADREPEYCKKIGENPPFGEPAPLEFMKLIGPDQNLFHKGRRAENLGLGIGAHAYYRRVIENQKNRIINEFIKVAEVLSVEPQVIAQLERAKNEHRFTRAIESIQGALPESLLIDGHNPLKLLHSALSRGIHAQSDEECIQISQDIRIVLWELATRLDLILKNDAKVKKAVRNLLKKG